MRKRLLVGLVLGAACLVDSSNAAPGGCTNFPTMSAFAFEQITVSTTSVGFTATLAYPSGVRPADMAIADVESQDIRYRADGVDPTATIGQHASAATTLTVCGADVVKAVRFIREDASDSTISVTYYRGTP